MAQTLVPVDPSEESRRTGAVWIAGTGAFLLLAAASVFVAVRWERIPDVGKLGLLVLLTGAFLAAGRHVRRTLPGTGDVLFDVGAFLVPIDLAAVGLWADVGWRGLLLAEGVLAVGLYPALARWTGSPVLQRVSTGSAAVLCGGVAACTPAPAPLVLVAAAAGALVAGRRGAAVVWAGIAGMAPVGGVLAAWQLGELGARGTGVLHELGLAGTDASRPAILTGVVAGWILAREARRRTDVGLAGLAIAALTTSAITTWAASDLGVETTILGVAAAFLLVETGALLLRSDPFWARPLAKLATASEALVGSIGGAASIVFLLFADAWLDHFERDPIISGAWALTAVAWLACVGRRTAAGGRWTEILDDAGTAPFIGLAVFAGAASALAGSASPFLAAIALVAGCGVLATTGRRAPGFALGLAAVLVPVVGSAHQAAGRDAPAYVAVLSAAAALLVAHGAARRWAPGTRREEAAFALSFVSLGTLWSGLQITTGGVARSTLLLFVVGAWAVALVLDRAGKVLGVLARLAMAVPVMAAVDQRSSTLLATGLAVTGLLAVDALRLRDANYAIGAAVTVQAAVAGAAQMAGLDGAAVGQTLAVSAVVWAGLAGLVATGSVWRPPLLVASAAALATGLTFTEGDPAATGHLLMVAGALVLAFGVAEGRVWIGHLGAGIAIYGLHLDIEAAGITAAEAIVAPVAAQLLVLGMQLRRRDPSLSSWVTHAPAIGLLGGVAFVERLQGGPAWHGLLAGAVGAAAVVAGGSLRLAGPLLAGTLLVGVVTIHESLGTLAGVPTWGWLGFGGVVLLGAGLALERSGQAPAAVGRRLVDVIGERFE